MTEQWITAQQLAELLPVPVSRSTVSRWLSNGKIAGAYKLPSGRWVIPKSEVEKLFPSQVKTEEP